LKKDIHPEYKDTTVTCACGNVIHTRSTRSDIRVEICSSCHPFFTGKQKLVDTAGRVERFRRKYGLEESPEEQAGAEEAATEEAPAEENAGGEAEGKKTAGKEVSAGEETREEEGAQPAAGERADAESSQNTSDDQ